MTTIYTPSGNPATLARGASAAIRNEFTTIKNGLDAAIPSVEKLNAHTDNFAVDTGAADAYLVTLAPAPGSYSDGMEVVFRALNTNTGASTINVNSLGVKTIKNYDNTTLAAGDIRASVATLIRYSTSTGCFHITSGAQASANAAAASAAAAAGSASAASTSASNASTSATNASNSAIAAAASAVDASNFAAGLIATSTTSLLIGTGAKTFTTQSGKQFDAGQFFLAASAANPANYMHGQITSYSSTTLIVDVQDVGGSGTYADWDISVSGSRGATGPAGNATGSYMFITQTYGAFNYG